MNRPGRTIAVAVHDVEPATFERCALIRDWLDDHGVDRVTLLVIPARDLHPLARRSPEMVDWLDERRRGGDSIAQHGFQHLQVRRASWPRQLTCAMSGARSAEFIGLNEAETRRAVDAGRRVLKLAGIEPGGFVAPAYAYTPALHDVLAGRYGWWATLLRVCGGDGNGEGPRDALAPAWSMGTNGPVRRAMSPVLIRGGALAAGRTLRLDLHPADLAYPRHMLALEWVLARAGGRRTAVTYDELAAG